jgi:hypothetical protein
VAAKSAHHERQKEQHSHSSASSTENQEHEKQDRQCAAAGQTSSSVSDWNRGNLGHAGQTDTGFNSDSLDDLQVGLVDSPTIISLSQIRRQILSPDPTAVLVCNETLQTVADLEPPLSVVLGKNEKHAVAFTFLAELPFLDQFD